MSFDKLLLMCSNLFHSITVYLSVYKFIYMMYNILSKQKLHERCQSDESSNIMKTDDMSLQGITLY
jgi:hypothetical protein